MAGKVRFLLEISNTDTYWCSDSTFRLEYTLDSQGEWQIPDIGAITVGPGGKAAEILEFTALSTTEFTE